MAAPHDVFHVERGRGFLGFQFMDAVAAVHT